MAFDISDNERCERNRMCLWQNKSREATAVLNEKLAVYQYRDIDLSFWHGRYFRAELRDIEGPL